MFLFLCYRYGRLWSILWNLFRSIINYFDSNTSKLKVSCVVQKQKFRAISIVNEIFIEIGAFELTTDAQYGTFIYFSLSWNVWNMLLFFENTHTHTMSKSHTWAIKKNWSNWRTTNGNILDGSCVLLTTMLLAVWSNYVTWMRRRKVEWKNHALLIFVVCFTFISASFHLFGIFHTWANSPFCWRTPHPSTPCWSIHIMNSHFKRFLFCLVANKEWKKLYT